MNQAFDDLAKLLPQYKNATTPAPSKIDILQNAIKLILLLINKIMVLDPDCGTLSDILSV